MINDDALDVEDCQCGKNKKLTKIDIVGITIGLILYLILACMFSYEIIYTLMLINPAP